MPLRFDARTRMKLNSMLLPLLLLAATAAIAWLSVRHPLQADWTSAGRHSLSEASLLLLDRLEDPLEITAYAREQPELRNAIRRFVNRYARVRPDIVLHFVNPDAVPDEVRNLGVSVHGELVLRYRGRIEHVRGSGEQEFGNALQRLLRGSERWLAFVEGHGERSPLGSASHDLGNWTRHLQQRGFRFQPLNLGESPGIPDNTSVLIVAGPQAALLPGEIGMLLSYVERGGNLLWLADPGELHGLEALALRLGIDLPAGTIIDFAGQLLGLDDPTITLVTTSLYGRHPALENFGLTTFFPAAGAILERPDSGWRMTPLLTTGGHTWLETGELKGEVGFDEDEGDLRGPLLLGAALEREREIEEGEVLRTVPQRVVVIADGDFLSNAYVAGSGNLELGLRLINWLSEDEDFIAIPARAADDMDLRMEGTLLGFFGLFFLLILPLALLITGVTVWWRRSSL
jgi:ABC-type uncharacterized transport system involved in gliding motility auxiliary subunit